MSDEKRCKTRRRRGAGYKDKVLDGMRVDPTVQAFLQAIVSNIRIRGCRAERILTPKSDVT